VNTLEPPTPVPETPAPKGKSALVIASCVAATLLIAGACLLIAANIRGAAPENSGKSPHSATEGSTPVDVAAPTARLPLPVEVRGVYITASTASSFDRYTKLISSIKAKGANAIVLDLKAASGSLAFVPNSATLRSEAPVKGLYDLDKLVAAAHVQGFYVIARYPVFEDPAFAAKHPEAALHRADGSLWRDARGLYWLDPAAESVWKYNVDIAKEAYSRGVDEIQFDYIRFATDGKTSQIVYPYYDAKKNMRSVIGGLFAYLDQNLRSQGIPISADVFGFTTWHQTDLGIGQWYADTLAHFDFVSPMVYPSHYPSGTLGFKNPAAHPYEIVFDSLKKGGEVAATMKAEAESPPPMASQRPWLQAFNMGAIYTPEMIYAQIKAARDQGASGFLLWNAGNNYSSLPNLTSNL